MATSDKYDRQLRLWGASGQRALFETCVVLVRATAAGTETLKNLVLPGVGAILVLDDAVLVTPQDIATNFFTPAATTASATSTSATSALLSLSRAQVACQHLLELNPDVQGTFVTPKSDLMSCVSSVSAWQSTLEGHTFGKSRILIVASDLEPPIKEALAKTVQKSSSCGCSGLILLQSYGLFGTVRIQIPPGALPIINPKPRDSLPDLRISSPFPALQDMTAAVAAVGGGGGGDWKTTLDSKAHKHIPYPLILVQMIQEYRQLKQKQQSQQQQQQSQSESGGAAAANEDTELRLLLLPRTYAEKQEFQALIKSHALNYNEEENFQQAVQNAFLAYGARQLNVNHIQELITKATAAAAAAAASSSLSSSDVELQKFVILLQALLEFATTHNGQPPLSGTIPDMTASTEWYVQLQTIYQHQAALEFQEFKQLVHKHATTTTIDNDTIMTFCQNAHSLDLILCRSLEEELYGIVPDDICQEFMEALQEEEEEIMNDIYDMQQKPRDRMPLLWYLGLQACNLFYHAHGRYPGTRDNYLDDVVPLQGFMERVFRRYRLIEDDNNNNNNNNSTKEASSSSVATAFVRSPNHAAATELCRYGNAEVHSIAALVGGVASQEAVKLITGQYTPIQHVYVYNGIACTAGVYKL